MFFRTTSGDTYPVSSIRRIETPYAEAGHPGRGPMAVVALWLGDEDLVSVHQIEVDRIMNMPLTAFSSPPSTFLLSYDEGEIQKKPILGWVVSQSSVRPVLAHGIFDDPDEAWVIETPDGSVTDEHAGHWPNIDAYRAYCIEREL